MSTLTCASTTIAALGHSSAAADVLSEVEKRGSKAGPGLINPGPMLRARALGRLAIASNANDSNVAHKFIDEAVKALSDLRLSEPLSEDVITDVAADLIILKRQDEAVALVKSPPIGALKSMRVDTPYAVASGLGRLAGVAYQLGYVDEGKRLIKEAKNQAAQVSDETRHSLALKAVAIGLFDGGQLAEALETVKMIQPIGAGPIGMAMGADTVRLMAYQHIAGTQAAHGEYAAAWATIKGADLNFPMFDPLRFIILEIAAKDFPGDTKTLFNDIQTWTANFPREKISPQFRAAIGSVLLRTGDQVHGLDYLNGVIDEAQQARAAVGTKKTGYDLHDFYIEAAAKGFAEAGEFDRARQLVNEQIVNPTAKRNIARWGALKSIAVIAFRRGHKEEGRRIINAENDQDLYDSVLHEWANIDSDSGKYNEAENLADEILSNQERAQSYVDIASRKTYMNSVLAKYIIIFRDEFMRKSLWAQFFP
jgi:tetratricopeptide (TPR) repeat protein